MKTQQLNTYSHLLEQRVGELKREADYWHREYRTMSMRYEVLKKRAEQAVQMEVTP